WLMFAKAPTRSLAAREPAEVAHSCPHCGKASRRDHWNESLRPRVQSAGALMSRTAISGLVCTTFLVLLGFPAVPQEPAGKAAATESGQQTFNNACRPCHTTKEGDNRLGPNLHNIIGRKAGSLPNYGYSSAMKGADFVWDKEKLDRFIAKPDEVVPGNNMKPYGGLTSAEDRARGDYILGVAHDQLSGYVGLQIQRGRISSRLSGNRGSAWGSSHAALHRRVSSFGREVRLLSLR